MHWEDPEGSGTEGGGRVDRDGEYIKKKKKKQRHYFANKGPSSQGYGFSSGHVWM